MQPLLVTIPEACGLLSVGKDEIYRLIREGEVQRVTIGRRGSRIVYASLAEHVDRLQAVPEPVPALHRPNLRAAV